MYAPCKYYLFVFIWLMLCGCISSCVPRKISTQTQTQTQAQQTNYDSIAQIVRAYIRSEVQAQVTSSETSSATGTRVISEVTVEFNDSTGAPKKQVTRNISEQYGKQTERQATVVIQENYFANFVDSLYRAQRSQFDSLETKIESIKEKTGLTKIQSYLLVSGVIGNILIILFVVIFVVVKFVIKK